MISNSGHDENGKYTGGQAGDQSKSEWAIINWYSRPWTVVLRHPDETVRKKIAELATQAATNNNIGYDQGQRYTFWEALKAAGYEPKNIKSKCEADCSAGVAAIVKAVGYILGIKELIGVSIYAYTGNLKDVLTKAGFKALTEKKYLDSDNYLYSGDILLYEGHHTATNVTDGKYCREYYISPIQTDENGIKVLTDINVRKSPGGTIVNVLKAGTIIYPSGKTYVGDAPWLQIPEGFLSGRYIEGWIKENNGKWWYAEKDWKYPSLTGKVINDREYHFDKEGYMITPDRIHSTGEIKY